MANSSKSVKQEPPTSQPPLSRTPQSPNVNGEHLQLSTLPPPPDAEKMIKSVSELGGLSAAIDTFKCRFDELQNHLNFIEKSIDARFKDLTGSSFDQLQQIATVVPVTNPIATTKPPVKFVENLFSVKLESDNNNQSAKKSDSELKQPIDNCNGDAAGELPGRNTIRHLCQSMCSRGLRKHLMSRLSDTPKLREEAPAALKLAPKPARLVFECIGRFFLQGKKAYVKDSPMIPARQASVLILEFFLLMMGDCSKGEVEIEPSLKEEAEAAAISWRNRLVSEGGIRKACDIDARGLLLFVACFGIPADFKNEDLRNLICLSNASEISEALRRSHILLPRIPDIIEEMVKYKFYVEAVDVAYIFGIEDKYPPQTILTSFLRESKEALKKTRRDATFTVLKEAKVKHVTDLKSVIKCLDDHKMDPTKLLPGWQIKEKINSLEKEIADLNKKISEKAAQKRKMDEVESSNRMKSQEMKRSRFTGTSTGTGSPLISPPILGLHGQRVAMYSDGLSPYNGLRSTSYLDSGLSSSLAQHGSSLPGLGLGMSSTRIGGQSTGLYAGIHGEVPADNENGLPYSWRGAGNASLGDRSFGGYRTSVGMDGLLRQPVSSLESYGGVVSHSSIGAAGNGVSGSDLYRFADSVVEGELYRSGGSQTAGGSQHPGVPAHLSSYLYL